MQIRYDENSVQCKSPFGAVKAGAKVAFTVFAKDGVFINRINVIISDDDGESLVVSPLSYIDKEDGVSRFCGNVRIDKPGLYWYRFELDTELGIFFKRKGESEDYQLTVYSKTFRTPSALKGGTIYHIFVDRFCKGEDLGVVPHGVQKEWNEPPTLRDPDGVYRANDFYGGNLQGIIDKLDYLESLRVSAIYLSPIFESSSNHRYDTGDYLKIDPLLGTEDKFRELVERAAERGISVILDGVFNHTGADSRYFNKFGRYDSVGAYQSKDSKYYDWYRFYDWPDGYDSWWGVTVCPTVNKDAEGWRKLVLHKGGVIKKWTAMGVKGWRLDVVDELPEKTVRDIRRAIKSVDPDATVIGEVWEDASNKISYGKRRHYLLGGELDGVMNYPFKEAILAYAKGGDAAAFCDTVKVICNHYPKSALDCCMTLIGTHDTVRALNALADFDASAMTKEERAHVRLDGAILDEAKARVRVAATLQFMLPGIPSIYYGDEIAMQGYEDPLNRMPMAWDDADEETLAFYRRLAAVRASHKPQVTGDIDLFVKDGLLILVRTARVKQLTVVANNSGESKPLGEYADSVDLLTGKKVFDLPPCSVAVFETRKA